MTFQFKPKHGLFSTESFDEYMIGKLIAEQRALERANMERRSELTAKILAYHKNGMSKGKLIVIYGKDMVNTVFSEQEAASNPEGFSAAVLPPDPLDSREPLSACGARVIKRMHQKRVGARA